MIGRLTGFGVEPRHLRAFRVVADRDSGLLQQIANPYARPRDPDGQALADETIRELASLFVQLHATLLRAELVRGSKA
ncbi:unannotated protein [freshwater metagenome]|uniref:Unannotated protein n=1 Tax=freshwater metagenome TaxID=449393 RepID=A0A6J6T5B3_9ZZZZ